jgi:predicted negative regulator of RcsB-dependent stress response
MKAKQRHQLKQNEFADTALKVAGVLREQQSRVVPLVIAAIVVGVAVGGFFTWRARRADKAGALLGVASAISQGQIAPPSTLPGAKQSPGTYPSEKARSEAALKAYQDVIAQYPSTDAATAARYGAAGELFSQARFGEAEQLYRTVGDSGSNLYAGPAKLGLAKTLAAEGKQDDAIKVLTDLSGERDAPIPVDGVLMQLADVYARAGKTQEAKAAYKRVIDEFAESPYVADARQRMAALE